MADTSQFSPVGIITVTTDFGTSDGYVGAMKGVILTQAPGLAVHDVAHEVAPQNVAHGAVVLRTACPWYPSGTVHVGVVDPGVGTERAAVVVLAGGHAFVGPDNGLFSLAVEALGGIDETRRIDRAGALASVVPEITSETFHGRDVFAPTAAALASGHVAPTEVGPIHDPVSLPTITAAAAAPDGSLTGHVTHVDRFGNAITNIVATALTGFPGTRYVASAFGRKLDLVRTYGVIDEGAACALVGSEGFVEIAVRGGSAAADLGIGEGTPVRVTKKSHGAGRS